MTRKPLTLKLSLSSLLRGGIAAAILCCFLSQASAQSHLIQLDQVAGAHQYSLAPASHATSITLKRALLPELRVGSEFSVQLDDTHSVILQVRQLTNYLNGDLGISANGRQNEASYSLTLTVGEGSIHGHASSDADSWQIEAVREGEFYRGWVYKPQPLSADRSSLQHDYLLPESPVMPAPRQIRFMPLLVKDENSSEDETLRAELGDINDGNLQINQSFNPEPVIVGGISTASVSFENTSSDAHRGLVAEFYFILEDSQLLSTDSRCGEQLSLSLQPILYCELGDIAAGQTTTVEFSIQTTTESQPYISSTVFVGNLRHDHFINVVEDVRTDTDGDGISDFNENLLGTNINDAASVDYSISTIDVMALYTEGASNAYSFGVETRINQLIGVANQIYRDSGVGITLRPVHHKMVDYNDIDDMDTALDHLMNASHPAFSDISSLRQRYGADLVLLFRPMELTEDRCGLAPIGGFKTNGYMDAAIERDFAFSYIAIDCPLDIVVAHELGHNMGLSHSHLEDGYGGTFNFSTGYGVDGQFSTVMAYPGVFNTDTRVARFSDPLAECLGFSCGVDADSEFGADAVQSLNLVRHQIANYYPTSVPDLPTTSVAALSGSTNAVIAIAASKDQGLSFSNQFSPDDLVDMTTTISVDDRHIGESGAIHVLVGELGAEQLYQLNGKGELVLWDGELGTLVPVGGTRVLLGDERLQLLDSFKFDPGLVGRNLVVYVAYQVFAAGDLIYTDAPLSFEIVGVADSSNGSGS